ncbi:PAS domain-containing protein [Algihabitans albus]|uniref:PAS domain-containing protein n=1 Tax=Algihabitans albus TaxID=2164067 RepID=UPI000E5CC42B|nr:PAS domain-containing protein [Algihabitans albus]
MKAETPDRRGEADNATPEGCGFDLFDWLGDGGDRHPHIRLLAEAWLTWRARARTLSGDARALPSLRDVDPLDMVPALPWVWLWAFDDTGRLRLRLVGEEAKRAIGNWDRGSLLEDVIPPDICPKVRERYDKVLSGPSVMTVGGEIVFRSGARVAGLRLVLPLGRAVGAGGKVATPEKADGLIGITSYAGALTGIRETGGLSEDARKERFLPIADLN